MSNHTETLRIMQQHAALQPPTPMTEQQAWAWLLTLSESIDALASQMETERNSAGRKELHKALGLNDQYDTSWGTLILNARIVREERDTFAKQIPTKVACQHSYMGRPSMCSKCGRLSETLEERAIKLRNVFIRSSDVFPSWENSSEEVRNGWLDVAREW